MNSIFINKNLLDFLWNIYETLYKIIKKAKNYRGKVVKKNKSLISFLGVFIMLFSFLFSRKCTGRCKYCSIWKKLNQEM